MEPGIEPATPGLQGKWFIHYTTAAPEERELVVELVVSVKPSHAQQECIHDGELQLVTGQSVPIIAVTIGSMSPFG